VATPELIAGKGRAAVFVVAAAAAVQDRPIGYLLLHQIGNSLGFRLIQLSTSHNPQPALCQLERESSLEAHPANFVGQREVVGSRPDSVGMAAWLREGK